jgi:hypothetical protein
VVELDLACGRDGRLYHFGEIAGMAEVEGDALGRSRRQSAALRPAGNLAGPPQYVAHPAGVEVAQRVRLAAGIDQDFRFAEQRETEFQRIGAGRVGEFVQE